MGFGTYASMLEAHLHHLLCDRLSQAVRPKFRVYSV
jgi:hypothetical protein